jgi:type II secretory pathway pseudopilin PulG
MVVIVIIGVLASLAIPRFTEASDKAKVAEAPRVLASYESAQLAHLAEQSKFGASGDIIFDVDAVNNDSKWFKYEVGADASGETAFGTASASVKIGKIEQSDGILTTLSNDGNTHHTAITSVTIVQKYLPNWFR